MTPPPPIHWVTDLDVPNKTDKNWNEALVKSERIEVWQEGSQTERKQRDQE